MNRYVLLLSAVVSALGVDATPVAINGPRRCCMTDDTFSALMFDLKKVNAKSISMMEVQVDFNNEKQAIVNYTMSAGVSKRVSRIVNDYKEGVTYYMPEHTNLCFKNPLGHPRMQRCVPDDAEYVGKSYMGAGQLPYDAWRMTLKAETYNMVITMTLSQDRCVPLLEDVSFENNPNLNQMFMFSGYQSGLKNHTEFNLPSSCFK